MEQEKHNTHDQEQDEEITQETIEQFNKVCLDATQLMESYKQQSEDLKEEITSMVTVYNKTASPEDAVPVDKIIEVTKLYENEMRSTHEEYQNLEGMLRKEENERDDMMKQIEECFNKLERMDKLVKEKKLKEKLEKEAKELKESEATEPAKANEHVEIGESSKKQEP